MLSHSDPKPLDQYRMLISKALQPGLIFYIKISGEDLKNLMQCWQAYICSNTKLTLVSKLDLHIVYKSYPSETWS